MCLAGWSISLSFFCAFCVFSRAGVYVWARTLLLCVLRIMDIWSFLPRYTYARFFGWLAIASAMAHCRAAAAAAAACWRRAHNFGADGCLFCVEPPNKSCTGRHKPISCHPTVAHGSLCIYHTANNVLHHHHHDPTSIQSYSEATKAQ